MVDLIVIGMIAKWSPCQHENPGEATVMILRERVRLLVDPRGKAVGLIC